MTSHAACKEALLGVQRELTRVIQENEELKTQLRKLGFMMANRGADICACGNPDPAKTLPSLKLRDHIPHGVCKTCGADLREAPHE